MSRSRKPPPPLPQPGESYQGASGGVRTVVGLEHKGCTVGRMHEWVEAHFSDPTHVAYKPEGACEEVRRVLLSTWRLWQRSARLVEPKA